MLNRNDFAGMSNDKLGKKSQSPKVPGFRSKDKPLPSKSALKKEKRRLILIGNPFYNQGQRF